MTVIVKTSGPPPVDVVRLSNGATVAIKQRLLDWQRRGLQQTASGYGRKLTSSYVVRYAGLWRRVYVTCYSNAGTAWIRVKGKTLILNETIYPGTPDERTGDNV